MLAKQFKEEMTGLERCIAAMSFQKPDRVPVVPQAIGIARRVLGVNMSTLSRDPDIYVEAQLHLHKLCDYGFDSFAFVYDLSVEAEAFGQPVIYPLESTAYADPNNLLIKTVDDYRRLQRINPRETGRMKDTIYGTAKLVKAKGKEYSVGGFVYGPLGVLGQMRGHERMFVDLMKNRDAVIEALEIITPVLEDYAVAQVEAGAGGITIDTLCASKTMMGSKMWVSIEAPYAKRIADAVRAAGGVVMLHNCGGAPYFEEQMDWLEPVGISHAYPAAGCNTWEEHAAKWGKKVLHIGAMDPSKIGMVWDEEQVMEDCRYFIETFDGRNGGLILAPGCEFPPNGALLNLIAICRAAKAYGAN